jgi:ATP synthase protein I
MNRRNIGHSCRTNYQGQEWKGEENMAQQDWENVKALGSVFSLAGSIAAGVLIGYWIGSFIDKKLLTDPWFTIIMVIIGVVVGFKSVYDIMVADKGGE